MRNRKLKFWQLMLKLIKKDAKKDYKLKTFNQSDIDKQLFNNYDKNNHVYTKDDLGVN